jgi:transcriptional regulator with XRE-family HTH domain
MFALAHPNYIREKARKLRRDKKLTIDELAERLTLSRTTIYYWVKDLPIPITAAQSLAQRRASKATRRKALMLREAAYDEGLKWFAFFSVDPLFRDFVCMYVAEGYKRCRNRVAICNSDPAVLKLAKPWFELFSANPISYSVQYHADQSPLRIQAFWGAELGIAPESIRLQRKSNSGGLSGRVWRSEHGVLAMSTSDTYFRAELQSWMDCVRDDWL